MNEEILQCGAAGRDQRERGLPDQPLRMGAPDERRAAAGRDQRRRRIDRQPGRVGAGPDEGIGVAESLVEAGTDLVTAAAQRLCRVGVAGLVEKSDGPADHPERLSPVDPDADGLGGEEGFQRNPADDVGVANDQRIDRQRNCAGTISGGQINRSRPDRRRRQFVRLDDRRDDGVGVDIAGADLQQFGDAPTADERRVTVQAPATVDAGRTHPRRRGDGSRIGDAGALRPRRRFRQKTFPQFSIGCCGECDHDTVMLEPGECGGEAAAHHHLEDLDELPELESRTTEFAR